MKRTIVTIITFAAILAGITSCGSKGNESKDAQEVAKATELSKNFSVDAAGSTLGWFASKVTGKHNGKISITSGNVSVEKNAITAGTFEIDMNSITDEDMTDEKMKSDFLGHMKSADFFDTEKHPTAKFEITGTEKMTSADSMKIMGNLTIKAISKNISIPAKVSMDSTKFDAMAKFKIDRTEWDIRYGSGKFFKNIGDKMIHDEIEFDLNLKAVPAK